MGEPPMKSVLYVCGAVAAMSMLSACATVVRGSTEDVQFVSNPPGAEVKTSLGPGCTAPCTIKFGRRDVFTAVFTLDGEERTINVTTEVGEGGAAVAGNLLLGGVIGAGVDVATGAGLDHVPNPVVADFTKPQEAQAPKAEETAEGS